MAVKGGMIGIEKKYPCRTGFIQNLCSFISNKEECFPPTVFIYGPTGTGKTAIVKDFLNVCKKQNQVHGVYVNCAECYTAKILFENTLEGLYKSHESRGLQCDSLKDFVEILRNRDNQGSYILALDNADRLRDMDKNILPTLLRLQELTGLNFCVLLISQIPYEKYYSKVGINETIRLTCSQYTKSETLKILSSQLQMTLQILKSHIKEQFGGNNSYNLEFERRASIVNKITPEFYSNYLNVFLSVFYKACRDIPELKMTACKCFMTYMEPIFNQSVNMADVSKLWRNLSVTLRKSLSTVYMHYEKTEINNLKINCADSHSSQSIRKMVQSVELPYYGKYLLIAAFLASHNSPKEDKRLFLKYGKQRKLMRTVIAKAKVAEKMSTSLGPKSFSIDRLLAIFYGILNEKVGLTCNLLSQISTLVHLNLLGFTSGENNIMDGSARLQCTVGIEFVLYISQAVGFNVCQYMCDFM